MKSFDILSEDILSTKFVLHFINVSELDKQYLMYEFNELSLNTFSQSSTKNIQTNQNNIPVEKVDISSTFFGESVEIPTKTTHSNYLSNLPMDGVMSLHTTLETSGVSSSVTKPIDTIVLNDELSLRLFASPIMNSDRRLNCWYDRNSIPEDWYPLGIPTKYNEKTKKFHCEGVFCSFNCMFGFIQETNNYRYKDSGSLIFMLYRQLFNKTIRLQTILPSPSWKCLKEYGGHLSIEEYRRALQVVEYKTMNQTVIQHVVEYLNEV